MVTYRINPELIYKSIHLDVMYPITAKGANVCYV